MDVCLEYTFKKKYQEVRALCLIWVPYNYYLNKSFLKLEFYYKILFDLEYYLKDMHNKFRKPLSKHFFLIK